MRAGEGSAMLVCAPLCASVDSRLTLHYENANGGKETSEAALKKGPALREASLTFQRAQVGGTAGQVEHNPLPPGRLIKLGGTCSDATVGTYCVETAGMGVFLGDHYEASP